MAEFRGDRLKKLRLDKGLSQSELARRSCLPQSKINRLEAGETRSPRDLFELAIALETTIEYLMGETDDASRDARAPVTEAQTDVEAAEQLGSVLVPQLQIGYSMGGGSVFEDYQQTAQVPFPRTWLAPMIKGSFADLFVARGEGDSMMPTVLDGDLVIVDTAQKRVDQQDRLWCLSYGDLGMIKRVRGLPDGGLQINSDNPAVAPFTAYDNEVHVIGRVIWIGRKV